MAAGSRRAAPDPSGFGKRGNVRLSARPPEQRDTPPASEPPGGFGGAFSSIPNPMKWAGGGLAVLAIVAMLGSGGIGGGGFLGGFLGGMLANRLMSNSNAATTPRAAVSPSSAHAPAADVARGGFGASASAHGGSSSS